MAVLGHNGTKLSIMIPTYNCASYLRETLSSLKAQGDLIADAEIIVLDDCSTRDNPETVVAEVWPGKVTFERHPTNIGPVANFNKCLQRATRDWIHILHGDDYLLPGAYSELFQCLSAHPDSSVVFGRSIIVDKDGLWTSMTPLLGSERRGVLHYHPTIWSSCPVQFAGVLFSRRAIDTVGEFDSNLTHVADWNLWWRLARSQLVVYSNECVGAYRIFPGNHTSTLQRSGMNIRERAEQVHRLVASGESQSYSPCDLYDPTFDFALNQLKIYFNDTEAFEQNLRAIKAIPLTAVSWPRRIRLLALLARYMRQHPRQCLEVFS
jgi:glycosyltransferase involved in cell wall biosynthesis